MSDSTASLDQFRAVIRNAGLVPPEVIEPDGKLRRFATNGKSGDDAGWYVMHTGNIPAGAFGCWRAGIKQTWHADIDRKLTADERRTHRERIDAIRREREADKARRHADAAARAVAIWAESIAAPTNHPYLKTKGVQSHGLRARGDALVIPLRNDADAIRSLEFIGPDGDKRFLTDGEKSGCYYVMGRPNGTLVIAEGYATAASVHEATGHAVAVAFDAGNLVKVAKVLRQKMRDVKFILAGDNDQSGTGQRAAREAALVVGGYIALPETPGADWNDVLLSQGAETVRASIDAARLLTKETTALDRDGGHNELSSTKQRIAELAKFPPVEYDRVRKAEAKALGIQLKTLDAEVSKLRGEASDEGRLMFDDPEPWHEEVDGAVLLNRIRGELEKYLVLPPHASTAIALWALHTWCLEAFYITPFLYPRSPEKRCGKTTLMLVIHELVRRPLLATNVSPAALFRCIEEYGPTLLLDEADAWLRENEELRGILNGGHSRKTARVIRTVGDNHDVRAFSTFCPKAIAGIGRLADTLEDRSIIVPMKRKRAEDRTVPLREDRLDLVEIRQQCQRWADDNIEALRAADPSIPPGLHDRAADNWRSLFAIADAAGQNWSVDARKASLALSGQSEDEAAGTQLLTDIRACFDRQENPERSILSSALVEHLGGMEDRPWSEWRQGKPITAPQIARLLKAFDIRPRTVRNGTQTAKGYLHEQFEDTFARYLPSALQAATPSQPHEFGSHNDGLIRNSGAESKRHTVTTATQCDGVTDTRKIAVTDRVNRIPYENRDCDGVTDQIPVNATAQSAADDRESF